MHAQVRTMVFNRQIGTLITIKDIHIYASNTCSNYVSMLLLAVSRFMPVSLHLLAGPVRTDRHNVQISSFFDLVRIQGLEFPVTGGWAFCEYSHMAEYGRRETPLKATRLSDSLLVFSSADLSIYFDTAASLLCAVPE